MEISVNVEQVTRGHNIVADGWAGASNPHPLPMPHTHTQKKHLKRSFSHFSTRVHGPTDRRTDGRTDGRTKPLIELLFATKKRQL